MSFLLVNKDFLSGQDWPLDEDQTYTRARQLDKNLNLVWKSQGYTRARGSPFSQSLWRASSVWYVLRSLKQCLFVSFGVCIIRFKVNVSLPYLFAEIDLVSEPRIGSRTRWIFSSFIEVVSWLAECGDITLSGIFTHFVYATCSATLKTPLSRKAVLKFQRPKNSPIRSGYLTRW